MLYWAVIGSGDVVNRLVKNSFHIPGKSSVKYIYSKKYDEAKEYLFKAHEIDRLNVAPMFNLGLVFANIKSDENKLLAKKWFLKAIRHTKRNSEIYKMASKFLDEISK